MGSIKPASATEPAPPPDVWPWRLASPKGQRHLPGRRCLDRCGRAVELQTACACRWQHTLRRPGVLNRAWHEFWRHANCHAPARRQVLRPGQGNLDNPMWSSYPYSGDGALEPAYAVAAPDDEGEGGRKALTNPAWTVKSSLGNTR